MEWRIGCSGFYYKEWKEIFYPAGLPQKDWFKYYCQHFNTIEINSSFYRQPSAKSFSTWHNTSPDDFLFSIKAPRTITHYNRFKDSTSLINDFYDVTSDGLKDKLGCILFQLPPSFTFSKEHLDLILNQMRHGFNNVIEPRHKSWWKEEVFEAFQANAITFSGISYPSPELPEDIIQNVDPVYYRFHGKPVLYKSLYPKEQIIQFTENIKPINKKIFVYFNNTWGNSALINSKQLIELTQNK
ncbi:DUF72 domain-containing protein [Pedobacter frigoris]|uniref:DUF72 domain-containing protein n=1 Tax=Pedobacter frigoris TaxID=2571272 RepID=A0A4U1CS86_9SPHI|nr:DUF72 domain-containing protein [Pedobacter frigoris]TKC08769.1 DUF72 domain-containing protein [Pedobacter frigoris]